jgi:NTP pyrophosphatase (non-canonical NTP hydrolase)
MLREIQSEAREWSQRNFGNQPSYHLLLGVLEELGELAHAHLKQSQGIRTNEDHLEGEKDAIGDLVIYLINYCTTRGWDLQEIVEQTWESVKKRDWIRYPERGIPPQSP